MNTSIGIHVGLTQSERIKAAGKEVGPGSVPSLTLTFTGPGQATDLTLFLWGKPGEVWDQLDSIIDACRDVKQRVVQRAAESIQPGDVCEPGDLAQAERGVKVLCRTHVGATYNYAERRCDAYLAAAEKQGQLDAARRANE